MKRSFFLKLLASALFFYALSRTVRPDALAEVLSRVEMPYVWLSFGISALMVLSSCLKWRWLLNHQQAHIPFLRLFRFYLIGYYFTNLLPSNMGGDVARSYYAGRDIGSQSHAAISVFMERITGMFLLLVLVLAAPAFRPWLYRHPAILAPAGGAMLLSGLLVWLMLSSAPPRGLLAVYRRLRPIRTASNQPAEPDRLERFLSRFRPKVARLQQRLADSARRLRTDRALLFRVASITLLFYALTWVNVFVTFRAFGVAVPLSGVAAVLPTAMIVAMLPLAPLASLGLAESSYVFYFGLLNVEAADALAMGLLLRLKLVTLGLLGLVCHLAPGIERLRSMETPHAPNG